MLRRKTATYALLALYEIAERGQDGKPPVGIRASDIASKHKLPKAYAAKILSQLASAGILHSDRGPRGGFRLQRSAEAISLFDVFDGVGAIVNFDHDGDALSTMPGSVRELMSRANDEARSRLRDVFGAMSVGDLISRKLPA